TENENVSAVLADTAAAVLLPEPLAEKLGAKPCNVSIRFHNTVSMAKDFKLYDYIDRLLTITHARFFVSSENDFMASTKAKRATGAGVYYVNSNYGVAIGGLARLLIPLLIAGTIILNTMLGTVYERKSEIAIYNAIGLNPTHIFMFFLAEAFVYSFIGSVGGYLIGQSLAMTLQHFHLVKDIGVNFSSLMVVYAILFTIGLVLLSTIYPAYVATKTAVPSGKHRWDMPKVEGRTMNVAFPFIYQGPMSAGVMYYIYEDFLMCSEKSLSSLIATFESKTMADDVDGRPVYTLTYSVGLTPFDLGVTQRVKLCAQYDAAVKSYRLRMLVEHLSGLDTNWVALNRFFLERMRRFLMVWRNMDPALYTWYSECGEKLFENKPLPPKPVTVSEV
ncbi:MAG: FtsX-like permease family protein, partial [bacterium]